jgi:hypothetical protein
VFGLTCVDGLLAYEVISFQVLSCICMVVMVRILLSN